jgi:hypothetical protein
VATAAPRPAPKPPAAQVAKKQAEIEQLRALMKAGTLSQAVAQAAIEKADIASGASTGFALPDSSNATPAVGSAASKRGLAAAFSAPRDRRLSRRRALARNSAAEIAGWVLYRRHGCKEAI